MQSVNTAFYKHIAHLFHAIAMADKKMVVDEKRKIVTFVEKYWTVAIEDTTSAEIIYETLRTLIQAKMRSEEAYEIFKMYFQANSEVFSPETCTRLMETVDGIALSASRRNKSELVLLTKIHTLLFNEP